MDLETAREHTDLTVEQIEKRRKTTRELVLNDDGEVIDEDEFFTRITDRYDEVEIHIEDDGCVVFNDTSLPTPGATPKDHSQESVYLREDIPVSACMTIVSTGTHPDEFFDTTPEERVIQQGEFNKEIDEGLEELEPER